MRDKGSKSKPKIEAPNRLKLPPLIPYRRYLQPLVDLAYLQSMSMGVKKPMPEVPITQVVAETQKPQSETEAKAWYNDSMWDVEFWMAFTIARAKLDAKDRGDREMEAVKTALDEYDEARKRPVKRRKRAGKGTSKGKKRAK